jgi:hypothetical protein
VYLIALL